MQILCCHGQHTSLLQNWNDLKPKIDLEVIKRDQKMKQTMKSLKVELNEVKN